MQTTISLNYLLLIAHINLRQLTKDHKLEIPTCKPHLTSLVPGVSASRTQRYFGSRSNITQLIFEQLTCWNTNIIALTTDFALMNKAFMNKK